VARLEIKVEGLARVRLFLYELHELASDMRVEANPQAERLTRIIERFGKAKRELDGGPEHGSSLPELKPGSTPERSTDSERPPATDEGETNG
jgi:hypothetical protein